MSKKRIFTADADSLNGLATNVVKRRGGLQRIQNYIFFTEQDVEQQLEVKLHTSHQV